MKDYILVETMIGLAVAAAVAAAAAIVLFAALQSPDATRHVRGYVVV
jgi:type II secretory pathway pseudopilin PulG